MKRSFSVLAAGAVLAVGGAAANADLISFTIPGATSFAPVPPTYQPLSGGVTIAYSNVGVYNGTPDDTSSISGGADYSYPTSGNSGTETFSFSAPVTVNSFADGVFDNTNHAVQVAYAQYSGPGGTGTLLASGSVTPAFNGGAGPAWTSSVTQGVPAVSGVESITFTNTLGGADAVNIDDISITVPEPASLTLGAICVAGLLARRRKVASH